MTICGGCWQWFYSTFRVDSKIIVKYVMVTEMRRFMQNLAFFFSDWSVWSRRVVYNHMKRCTSCQDWPCTWRQYIKSQPEGYICISTRFFSCNTFVWLLNMISDYWKQKILKTVLRKLSKSGFGFILQWKLNELQECVDFNQFLSGGTWYFPIKLKP